MNNTDICMYCRSNLVVKNKEFIARVGDHIVVINDLPAMVCTQCGEAYYDDDAMEKIEIVRTKVNKGEFLAHPIAAGSIDASEIGK